MSPQQQVIHTAMVPLTLGATLAEISVITGISTVRVAGALSKMTAKGEAFQITRPMFTRYFADAATRSAAEGQIRAAWLADDEKKAARKTAYKKQRHLQTYTPRPKPAMAVAVNRTAAGRGWGKEDPAHITSETIVTICPTLPRALRTNTHSQF